MASMHRLIWASYLLASETPDDLLAIALDFRTDHGRHCPQLPECWWQAPLRFLRLALRMGVVLLALAERACKMYCRKYRGRLPTVVAKSV